MTERAELPELLVEIDSVEPYPDNPRVGDVRTIARSLEANGQYRPIVVNKRTNEILAGNHTWKAAKYLGWATIAATFVDVDDDTARRIVLVDNRANDLARYEDDSLLEMLQSIVDDGLELIGTGYSEDDIAKLLETSPTSFEPVDPDEQPRIDQRAPLGPCPQCGTEWRVGARGEIEIV